MDSYFDFRDCGLHLSALPPGMSKEENPVRPRPRMAVHFDRLEALLRAAAGQSGRPDTKPISIVRGMPLDMIEDEKLVAGPFSRLEFQTELFLNHVPELFLQRVRQSGLIAYNLGNLWRLALPSKTEN